MATLDVGADGPAGRLTGTIWLPQGPPRGVVLLHPGSGPSDRTNAGYFDDHIEALTTAGYAAAGFDKRGVRGSAGQWTDAGIVDQAQDAAAGAEAVRVALPELPLHLFGHSQGGWVTYAAHDLIWPKTLSTTSGPAVTPNEQQVYSTRSTLLEAGWSTPDVDAGVALVADQFDQAMRGVAYEAYRDGQRSTALWDRLRAEGVFLVEDRQLWELVALIGGYDPLPALRAVDRPLFACFGEADGMVPVARSAELLRQVVPQQWLSLHVVPRADHVLRTDGPRPVFLDAWLSFLDGTA